ncbi:MAG: sigma-70 family RNA polymerase sigma factor [Planctomycetes bacterium]|nr:sigma-70 family RNA polymerase sigma factor [Planctomycetota bacterium]
MNPASTDTGPSVGIAPDMDSPGEQELLNRARSGDADSFCLLVAQHQSRLFTCVYRMLGHMEDAQDVVQEAFLNAYLSLSQFKGDARFFTWIYRIALNAAISHRRKAMHRINARMIPIDESGSGFDPQAADIPADAGLIFEDNSRQLHAALDRLSPDHRAVLVMKDMEDMRYESMAEILEVPIGTIRSRLHRARLELRSILEQETDSGNRGELS